MPDFKLKERRLPSRRYPLRSIRSTQYVNFAQAILSPGVTWLLRKQPRDRKYGCVPARLNK
jgi:hypothetical protein